MRIFVGNQWIQNYLMKHGMVEGEPLEHRMVSRAIEKAQTQVEAHNFDVRKHLLDYDDVMNRQREAIYSLRSDILLGKTGRSYIDKISHDLIDYLIDIHCPEKASREDWELTELKTDFLAYFDINLAERNLNLAAKTPEEMRVALIGEIEAKYSDKETRHGDELIRQTERVIALQTVDRSWKDHLLALDHLKEGIGLRGYGQRDPKQEYKKESFDIFQAMKERIEDLIIKAVFRAEPITEEEYRARRRKMAEGAARRARLSFSAPAKTTQPSKRAPIQIRKAPQKIGRNAPCPCGSGKKYKKCHGAA